MHITTPRWLGLCLACCAAAITACAADCVAGPTWPHPRVILAFADSPRRVALANWALQTHAVAHPGYTPPLDETLIVCTDDKAFQWCTGMGLNCSRHALHGQAGARSVWRQRAQMMVECVNAGLVVLIQDLDAIWRRDPRPLMDSLHATHHADVVGARGFYPPEIGASLGATLCMGFTQYHPTPPMRAVLERYLEHMLAGTYDTDQRAMNHILFHNTTQGLVQKCGPTHTLPAAHGATVALLSAPLFALETCWDSRSRDAYMLHPGCLRLEPGLCLRSAENKMFALVAHDLFHPRALRAHTCLKGSFHAFVACLIALQTP